MRWGGWVSRMTAALGLAVLPFAAGSATAQWSLVDIGTLGGPGSYGAAINNSGVVAGCADVAGGGAHAFAWSAGTMVDLGTASDAPGSSCALAVNSQGTVAGRASSGELVIWNGSAVTRLGVHGDIGDIDDRGVVVGSYRDGAASVAFRYANGALSPLGALGDNGGFPADGFASGINARGQIVGRSNGLAFIHEHGAMRPLGTLGGSSSGAKSVNDRGDIVGMATDTHGQPQSFIFDGAMRGLPAPGYSGAVAINNRGQVVGSAEGSFGYLIEGDSYTRLDTLPAVQAKGWRRVVPTGINDRGWIVGTAHTREGDMRAFILMPGDVPGSKSALAPRSRPMSVAGRAGR